MELHEMLLVYYRCHIYDSKSFPKCFVSWIITHYWNELWEWGQLLKPALLLMKIFYNSCISYSLYKFFETYLFLHITCKFYKISPFWCMISFIFSG